MGQYRYREPSLKTKLLGFVGGTLLVAACLDAIAHFSMDIIRAHYRGEILGSRINFHDCPIWKFLHTKGGNTESDCIGP